MSAPVELFLNAFRRSLPLNLLSAAHETSSLPRLISECFLPLLRDLHDSVPERKRLCEEAPLFDATLSFIETTTTTTGGVLSRKEENRRVIDQMPLSVFSAVLPWETALGLSYADLAAIQENRMKKESKLPPEQEQGEKERKKQVGMLFASSGLLDQTARGGGGKVPWSPANFWSGAIVQPISVLYLQHSDKLPDKAVYRSRTAPEVSDALQKMSKEDPNGFHCKQSEVCRLDPLSMKNSRFHECISPRSRFAPMFVLELPLLSCSSDSASSFSSMLGGGGKNSTSGSATTMVKFEPSKELCFDIDRKMLVSSNLVPSVEMAANETLARLCAEVLQSGASIVRSAKMKKFEEKLFREGNNMEDEENQEEKQKREGEENLRKQENVREWSGIESEFLCLCTQLNIGTAEQVVTTWECLADKINRELNEMSQSKSRSSLFLDGVFENDSISRMLKDSSVWLPDSIHAAVMKAQLMRT